MLLLGRNSNKYDLFIFVLILSLSFGILGNALQAPRIIGFLLIPQLGKVWPYLRKHYKTHLTATLFFLIYATFSLVWTPDIVSGIKELCYYIIHFIIFFEIIGFSCYAKDKNNTISLSWLILVSITLIIAYWEIITGNHLSVAFQDSDLMGTADYGIRRFASVTFGNYNAYVTFICFAYPFLLYRFNGTNKTKVVTYGIPVVLLLSFASVLINASRGGLLSLVIMYAIYFIHSKKSFKNLFPLLLLVVLTVYAVSNYGELLFSVIEGRISDTGFTNDTVRTEIWSVALQCFINSAGMGVGIGGNELSLFAISRMPMMPHNMFIEVLMEFGAIVFMIFIISLIKTFKKGRKSLDKGVKIVSNCFFLSLPIVAVIDSSYCLSPLIFIVFASVYSFTLVPCANINRNVKHYGKTTNML